MDNYYHILKRSPLFQGIGEDEFLKITDCFHARIRNFCKGDIVLLEGYPVTELGLVLTGRLEASREEKSGRSVIITSIGEGGMFADALSSSGDRKSPVRVVAAVDSVIMFLDHGRLIRACANACPCHAKLIENTLKIISDKYFAISRRIDSLILKGMRRKLCHYFLETFETAGVRTFVIPFDRKGLSEFLNVDRSAMSRELSRMKQEGLIDYYKSSFKLLNEQGLRRHL